MHSIRPSARNLAVGLLALAAACSGGGETPSDAVATTTSAPDEQSVVQIGLPCEDQSGEPDTFYVAAGGSDDADGRSPADPWRTIDRVNSTDLEPGQAVRFASGGTYRGRLQLDGLAGSSSEPITIGSYCDG